MCFPRVSSMERLRQKSLTSTVPGTRQSEDPSAPIEHPWRETVPDNSELPPPPALGYDDSPSDNATEAEAIAAAEWCQRRPLHAPITTSVGAATMLGLADSSNFTLTAPPFKTLKVKDGKSGRWTCEAKKFSNDSCLFSREPLYAVNLHSPLNTRTTKTIYYEVYFQSSQNHKTHQIRVALGFAAMPYPNFRLPGWQRGSLGIHGDDGRRYINDNSGGKDATTPFLVGDTVGIGMTFSFDALNVESPPAYGGPTSVPLNSQGTIGVEYFFTRNGRKEVAWNIHEETDSEQDGAVTGLEGAHDLYAAIGTYDRAYFEVILDKAKWKYQPL